MAQIDAGTGGTTPIKPFNPADPATWGPYLPPPPPSYPGETGQVAPPPPPMDISNPDPYSAPHGSTALPWTSPVTNELVTPNIPGDPSGGFTVTPPPPLVGGGITGGSSILPPPPPPPSGDSRGRPPSGPILPPPPPPPPTPFGPPTPPSFVSRAGGSGRPSNFGGLSIRNPQATNYRPQVPLWARGLQRSPFAQMQMRGAQNQFLFGLGFQPDIPLEDPEEMRRRAEAAMAGEAPAWAMTGGA